MAEMLLSTGELSIRFDRMNGCGTRGDKSLLHQILRYGQVLEKRTYERCFESFKALEDNSTILQGPHPVGYVRVQVWDRRNELEDDCLFVWKGSSGHSGQERLCKSNTIKVWGGTNHRDASYELRLQPWATCEIASAVVLIKCGDEPSNQLRFG